MSPTTGYIANPRVWATGSIASGAALSNAIDTMGYLPVAIEMSSGFEGAQSLWVLGSNNASDYYPLKTSSGGVVGITSAVITSATGCMAALNVEFEPALAAYRYIKFQTSANISTGVTFKVNMRPL